MFHLVLSRHFQLQQNRVYKVTILNYAQIEHAKKSTCLFNARF